MQATGVFAIAGLTEEQSATNPLLNFSSGWTLNN
jgi:hypothetical protein